MNRSRMLIAGLAVAAAVAALGRPTPAQAWERADFLVTSERTWDLSVASLDRQSVLVVWQTDDSSPRVAYRAMLNQEWLGGIQGLGFGRAPRLVVDGAGVFHVLIVQDRAIDLWSGTPDNLQGPVTLAANEYLTHGPASLVVAPDDALYVTWRQGTTNWWSTRAPGGTTWATPQLLPGTDEGPQVVPRLVAGSWQPRVYTASPAGGLSWCEFDGVAWTAEVAVPLDPPAAFGFQVILLTDGRHALRYGDWSFCGNYYWEEDAAGVFQPQPWLLSLEDPDCTISDGGPMPGFAAVDALGRVNVFRNESCFEWYEGDLWGCGFRLLWQWQESPGADWTYADADEFPGADAWATAMDPTQLEGPGPVFAWASYDGIHLRVLSPEGTAVLPAPPAPLALRAAPNPALGATTLSWSLPSPPHGDGLSIQIFDVAGRLLRAWQPPAVGEGSLVWDGCDAEGRLLPAGVYLARASAAGVAQSLPIVLLR